jgi:hypothetical protein
MPRRDGDVFLLGTAISQSSRGVGLASSLKKGRLSAGGANRNADKAALIEEDWR